MAMTRMSDRTSSARRISPTLIVRITSTRSFGKTKPPAVLSPDASMGMDMARMPVGRTADTNPEPDVFTNFSRLIGSPSRCGTRAYEPFSAWLTMGSADLVIMPGRRAAMGKEIHFRSRSDMIAPGGMSRAATRISSRSDFGATGASTWGGGSESPDRK